MIMSNRHYNSRELLKENLVATAKPYATSAENSHTTATTHQSTLRSRPAKLKRQNQRMSADLCMVMTAKSPNAVGETSLSSVATQVNRQLFKKTSSEVAAAEG